MRVKSLLDLNHQVNHWLWLCVPATVEYTQNDTLQDRIASLASLTLTSVIGQ